MTGFPSLHSHIILDACCIINLCATGRMEEILRALEKPLAVAEYVHRNEILHCNLQPLIDQGLLVVTPLASSDESTAFVSFARYLEDGEAMTGAIAVQRNWALASDERKVITFFEKRNIHVISTLEMIKHWVDIAGISVTEIKVTLQDLQTQGRYIPHLSHKLYAWWKAHQ